MVWNGGREKENIYKIGRIYIYSRLIILLVIYIIILGWLIMIRDLLENFLKCFIYGRIRVIYLLVKMLF